MHPDPCVRRDHQLLVHSTTAFVSRNFPSRPLSPAPQVQLTEEQQKCVELSVSMGEAPKYLEVNGALWTGLKPALRVLVG